jgi:hypothetical protein
MRRPFLAVLCLLLLALPAAARASTAQVTSFEAPRDLLDPAARQGALDEIGGFGIQALRIVLYWHDVAPDADASSHPSFDATNPANYDWSRYDPAIDAAAARGWRVLLTVSGPVPKWATLPRRDTVTHPSPKEFGLFMQAVARHYAGKVALWSIWNEPNHPDFLMPQYFRGQPASGLWYRKLFVAGRDGLVKGGIADPTVLMGETAPVGTGRDVAPLVFLRQALCLNSRYHRIKHMGCGRLPASGYAHHAYTKASGPFYVPPGRDDVTIGVLGRLTGALDRAARAGAIPARLPVYLTEFGIQSVPDPYYGVSQARQAEFQAISEDIAWHNPRVRWFSQYLLRDDPPVRGVPKSQRYSGFESGLRFADGRPKVSLRSFPVPLAALRRGSHVYLWGLARPAHARTSVVVEAGTKRFRRYLRLRTDARGFFTRRVPYVPGRRYRLSWAGRTGPPIRVYRQP